jgi:beta-glucanase (GH16 family)
MTSISKSRVARSSFLPSAVPVKAIGGIAIVAVLSLGEATASNLLTNAGFELGNFNNWTTVGGNNYVQTGGNPHSGTHFYKVYGAFSGVTNYTGIYQDIPSGPGSNYLADGWAYSDSGDSGGIHGQDSIWVEVSFRDSSKNALALYRSPVVTGGNIAGFGGLNTWFDLQITNQCSFSNPSSVILTPGNVIGTVTNLVAPAGTAWVRYQTVFRQGTDNANGSMYFDDLALNDGGAVTSPPPPVVTWNLVWSDEFNGTVVDTNNWAFEIGNNGGWGNAELEYYTNSTSNAYVAGGLLHIVARQQSVAGFSYTSARMKSLGLYSTPVYGRFEWRAKLPAGVGMWPALWMMGTNFPTVGWPYCGEIDVVENNGANPTFTQGSLHSPNGDPTAIYNFTGGDGVTNFHTYRLEWNASTVQWFVDGALYETQPSSAPFNAPFFFLMNLAVGGHYVGDPTISQINAGTVFPQELQVDYVRVYEQTPPLQISVSQNAGNIILSWPSNIVCHLQSQTNSLVSGNWSDLGVTPNPFILAPDPNSSSIFFRLESP